MSQNNPPELLGVDAVIIHDPDGNLWGVFPDTKNKKEGESFTWVIPHTKEVTITFEKGHSPFSWTTMTEPGPVITSTLRSDAAADEPYKYEVKFDATGESIDPRIRVGK